MSEVREHLEVIYATLDIEMALSELSPKDMGGYYLLDCPKCGNKKNRAYLYKNTSYIKCNRLNQCDFTISIWDYIQNKQGLSSSETLQELARLANYELPTLSEGAQKKAKETRDREEALKIAFEFFKQQLWSKEGREVLEYLKGRAYTETDIEKMELGSYPGYATTLDYLKKMGYTIGQTDKMHMTINGDETPLKWLYWRNDYRLIIPYKDSIGRIKGLFGRLIRPLKEGEKESDKYKPLSDADKIKDIPFLLDRAKGSRPLVIVEGYMDALIIDARGGKGAIGLGGASLLDTQIETIKKYGSKEIVLCLDNDLAGHKGTEKALEKIGRAGLRAFVSTLPEGYKDPDEYIRANGIEAFKELIHKAQSGVKWQANHLMGQYDLTTDMGYQAALEKVIEYEETLINPLESEQFKGIIRQVLDIPESILNELTADYHEKKARERLRLSYQELLKESQRLLNENKLTDLKDFIHEKTTELRAKSISKDIKPPSLEGYVKRLKEKQQGLKTGYENLDNLIRIPQEAITIIAGRPSHGKTTFLLNLYLNMIKTYPEKAFFFFSYEETEDQLITKIINILSGAVIDEAFNISQIENYMRGENTNNQKIETGKSKFARFTEDSRLWIIDEPYYIEELIDTLAYLHSRYNIGAVFIDYIQKIKINGRYPTRQMELKNISESLLEAAKGLSIPIILGAQLGRDPLRKNKVRLDNLRESGDIEQDANMVIGIYNEAVEKAQDEGEKLKDRVIDLNVTVLKNRNGKVNETVNLEFDRPVLWICDTDDKETYYEEG